jgi:hypothetical protein
VASLGNPMLGMHGVLRPAETFWISLGGAFGFPLVGNRDDVAAAGAAHQAYWNLHHYIEETVPLQFQLLLEGHVAGIALLRAEMSPVLHINTASRGDAVEIAMQHAFEFQLGHEIGGGLRLQGVWLATTDVDDNYQLAFEPFLVMEKELLFLRFGMLLPLTNPLGPPFDPVWGIRAATGIRVD